MESGINADQNFYSRRPLPNSTESHQGYHHQPAHPLDPPPLQTRSPELPPKLPYLTTANLQAVTSNGGFIEGLSSGGGDPDEFYREYRGVQQSSHNFSDGTANGMPAITSELRPSPSSLRSNGNGTTPKHPPLPGARNNLKPSYRSASAPTDGRTAPVLTKSTSALNGFGQPGKTSVKDLLKKFDQSKEASPTIARKPAPIATRQSSTNGPGYKDRIGYKAGATGNSQTTGTSKAGALTREAGPGRVKSPTSSRSTQRTRFATEDQHSNNTLSAAARSTRPRNAVSANSQASKSMINLSPNPSNPPSQLTRKPLFGEVLPFGQGLPDVGFGIHAATRRTSDSSLHPSWSHLRSKSVQAVSPSSPTAWYLGVTPDLEDVDTNKPRSSPAHNRNHSDFADRMVNTMNGVNPDFQSPYSLPISNPDASKPSSRLPLSSRKTSIPSDSSSPTSSRSDSPFAKKVLANGKARKAVPTPWSPAGRSTTPTNRTTTPTNRSPRGKARSPEQPSNLNNSSLKAYISSPPPKASPPLRGSRHRQPVSTATTASSRQKVVDPAGSPKQSRTGMKITRTGRTDEPKQRKIPDGPVNFAERRERIQRAYTKSIHESEQREIRAANLRRLQDRDTKEVAARRATEELPTSVQTPVAEESSPEVRTSPAKSPNPLHISTTFTSQEGSPKKGDDPQAFLDSPTLGIPGSFVEDDDEAPPSAVSNATGITEFDNEPQTEAARNHFESRPLSSQFIEWNDLSPEQATFGINQTFDRNNGSIQIMLDASPAEDHPQESTPTNDAFARDPSPPGAFKRDSEYDQPTFVTTITTASPKEATPERSRPVTPLESGDELDHSSGEQSHGDVHVNGTSPMHPPPEILFHADYESRIQPTSDSTLAPPSSSMNGVHDYLNTPASDMGYESSDGYGVANTSDAEYDPYASHTGVQSSARMYRSSHQSNWTDYSVETTGSSEQGDYHRDSYAAISEDHSKPLPPPKELTPQVPPKPDTYSPQPSPLFPSTAPRVASPTRDQLPPLSTGDEFGFSDRSPNFSGTVPLWPEYSPPPPPAPQSSVDVAPAHPARSPPPPSFFNRRPPSSLYHGSQNGTSRNTESRRASDDVYSPRASISTPRSSTQISLEDVSAGQSFDAKEEVYGTEEDRKTAEKLRKRLFQRRMIMKELIDTESVYLKDMNVVEEIYKGTAEACPNLDTNDIKAIFRNTDEIVAFSTLFLDELKSAISSVYSPRSNRARQSRAATSPSGATSPGADNRLSIAATLADETDEQKDKKTFVGANFGKHLKRMQTVYTDYLKNSELASTRLSALQADGAVQVWLSECNTVAKDLTAAWDLDALLVKPVQRITRYQLLLAQIQEHTPEDHPDYQALQHTCRELSLLLKNIDDLKKRIHMVGKIVGRKRKESDVRSGLAKAFGRRAEKLASSNANRPPDDEIYVKLHERYGEEYVKLQVVLRDAEYYTREVASYVNGFLRFLSSIELVMRLSASPFPELESKWARFNMSMRDMGTVALEDHVSCRSSGIVQANLVQVNAVRRSIIEPFEQIITAYGPPGLAMKKRNKRRLDYEKSLALKAQGKKIDSHLAELVDQYEALNETLKLELPKLSSMTGVIGKICLTQFIHMQSNWFSIWQDKVKVVLEESQIPKDIPEIIEMFNRDFPFVEARAQELGIVNGTFLDSGAKTRESSQSTLNDDASSRKGRPSNLSSRSRGMSVNSDKSPSLPTPDFAKRLSGQFAFSPIITAPSAPQLSHQNQPYVHSRNNSGSPATPDPNSSGSRQHVSNLARPNTGRSLTSDNGPSRLSTDRHNQYRRESGSTFSGNHHVDGPPLESSRPYSGIFHSAMPLPDGPEESQRSSRASSRDRNMSGGYNILYLAASLFEFNISATKSEAGYPYLTYQAGEVSLRFFYFEMKTNRGRSLIS
jgi:hypothetical protein